MPVKLMYITNRPEVAQIAAAAGVDRIFVDMEFIGKALRQGGMDTVQNHHTIEDIQTIRKAVPFTELLVRVNPMHETPDESAGSTGSAGTENDVHSSSRLEIEAAIGAGADILMLPYYKTTEEVSRFIEIVGGRARTMPLLETPEAEEILDEVLALPGLDEIYIGLNDLSLGYGYPFMFEPLANGIVEKMSRTLRKQGLPFGFGGIAAPGTGTLPADYILGEHHRLGSSSVILSRSFCNTDQITDLKQVERIFNEGVRAIREVEACWASSTDEELEENRKRLVSIVDSIVNHSGV